MKKTLFAALVSLFVLSCGGNDNTPEGCNFLLNIGVSTVVNMNLPQFSQLEFPNNPVYIPNAGNGGIIVNNTGFGFRAFDAADPNHAFNTCSVLQIDGIEAECGCQDANRYSLINGQPLGNDNLQCGLRMYVVQQNGSDLLISN